MNIIRNIITSYVTSLIGLAIIIFTSYQCIFKDTLWIWEGFAGLFAGSTFLYLSDKEVKAFLIAIKDLLFKKFVGK